MDIVTIAVGGIGIAALVLAGALLLARWVAAGDD
jgi:hypothetical protein